MLPWLRKVVKLILLIIAGAISLIVLYGIAAVLLSVIPVNRERRSPEEQTVDIYFTSNGVHFDIILPVRNEYMNWTEEVLKDFTNDLDSAHVGFGWGDKEFYLTTPTWADLTFATAFKALFLKSESALHVSFYPHVSGYGGMKKLRISPVQYRAMVRFIASSFRRNEDGKTIRIQCFSYGYPDCYYEAMRSYSLFYTCNTWANQAFKKSGLRACVWTPFDKGLLFQYRNVK
ncbi:MAG: TIGR02117 family protein [Bacteroidia bacterium]|nr:TIGR02117 family protein [Bacteroidia bacterium]